MVRLGLKPNISLPQQGRWAYLLLALCLVFLGSQLSASTYKAAYKNYARRNLAGCIKSSAAAIKKTRNRQQIASLYKLSGICYHQMKKNSSAYKMFKNAIKFDSSTSISSAEVLDSSVVSYFNKVKASLAKPRTPARPRTRQVAKGAYAKQAKTTSIVVKSNISNAFILMDGIIVGKPGSPIEVDPGSSILTVQSKGYITRKIRVFAKKNHQTPVTINLSFHARPYGR